MYPILLIALVVTFSFAYASLSGAPWVPTWKADIERLIQMLRLKPGEKLYELGCGDGRVCTTVAKRSGATCVGIELSIAQCAVAKLRAKLSGAKKIRIKWGNAFKADLSDADAVYMFLMPDTYESLRPKFEKELKPGARVVSYVWPIPGWTPVHVDRAEGKPALYLYEAPFKI